MQGIRFLRYARGSAYETSEWLRDGKDRGHFSDDEFDGLWALVERVCGALTRLIISLERKDRRDSSKRRVLVDVP